MNPPFSRGLIEPFIAKLIDSLPNLEAACVLVHSGTETGWGQSLLANCAWVCFPSKRIRFNKGDGTPAGSPLQGHMICGFGEANPEPFLEMGTVLVPRR